MDKTVKTYLATGNFYGSNWVSDERRRDNNVFTREVPIVGVYGEQVELYVATQYVAGLTAEDIAELDTVYVRVKTDQDDWHSDGVSFNYRNGQLEPAKLPTNFSVRRIAEYLLHTTTLYYASYSKDVGGYTRDPYDICMELTGGDELHSQFIGGMVRMGYQDVFDWANALHENRYPADPDERYSEAALKAKATTKPGKKLKKPIDHVQV